MCFDNTVVTVAVKAIAVPQSESLSTDAGHRSLPYQYSVEVAHLPVQPLVLSASQTKPNSQEHQGQSDHPCKHKADRPHVKPEARHTVEMWSAKKYRV